MKKTPLCRNRPLKKRSTKKRPAIIIYPDGRQVCNLRTCEGRAAYNLKMIAMWQRQGEMCCLFGFIEQCPGYLAFPDATFEHEDGRGMGAGKRDDRTEKDGHPYNGVAHKLCNELKGSRYFDYNGRWDVERIA